MEEKKAMVALLGFIFATLEIGFDLKKVFLSVACVQTSPLPQEKSGEETSVNRRR